MDECRQRQNTTNLAQEVHATTRQRHTHTESAAVRTVVRQQQRSGCGHLILSHICRCTLQALMQCFLQVNESEAIRIAREWTRTYAMGN